MKCVHTERRVELDDAPTILPQLAAHYDEPFADPSAIPTWYVSRLAREQVTVAMSGDGGDELFAGYERHYNERLVHTRRPLFALASAVAKLPPLPVPQWNYFRQRLAKVSGDATLPNTFQRFFSKYQLAPRDVRAALYRPEFTSQLDAGDELERLADTYFPQRLSSDPVEELLYADTVVRLPDDMLTKVDRASMAHSLEVRVPFLAHTFVDFAATVPIDMKLRGSTGKYLVRKAIEPWLPPGILDRPKQGFAVPLARWVRGDFGNYVESLWRDSRADEAGALRPRSRRGAVRGAPRRPRRPLAAALRAGDVRAVVDPAAPIDASRLNHFRRFGIKRTVLFNTLTSGSGATRRRRTKSTRRATERAASEATAQLLRLRVVVSGGGRRR